VLFAALRRTVDPERPGERSHAERGNEGLLLITYFGAMINAWTHFQNSVNITEKH